QFRLFHWPEDELVIVNAGREEVEQFARNARDRSHGKVHLQHILVNMEDLGREVPNAKKIVLEREDISGLEAFVNKMSVEGRDVGQSAEVRTYREGGGTGTGLSLFHEVPGWG